MTDLGPSSELISRIFAMLCVARVIALTRAEFFRQMNEDLRESGAINPMAFIQRTIRSIRWSVGTLLNLILLGHYREDIAVLQIGGGAHGGYGVAVMMATLVYEILLRRSAAFYRWRLAWDALKSASVRVLKAAVVSFLPIPDEYVSWAGWVAGGLAAVFGAFGFLPMLRSVAVTGLTRFGPKFAEWRSRRCRRRPGPCPSTSVLRRATNLGGDRP